MIPGSGLSPAGSVLPLLVVVVPALAAIVVYRSRRSSVREPVSVGSTLVTFALLAWMATGVIRNGAYRFEWAYLAPGIPFELTADPVGLVFALTVAGVYLVTVPYTIRQLRRRRITGDTRVIASLMASQAVAIGAALAGNLLGLFLFLELLTLTTYPLIAHGEDRASRRAGYAYLAYGFSGGLSVLIGTRLVYAEIGAVTFVPGGLPQLGATAASDPGVLRWAFFLFVLGFAVKSAVVPLHSWFVRARVTTPPLYGAVFGIVVLTTGTLGLFRIVLDLFGTAATITVGGDELLLGLGVVTIVVAGTMCLAMARLRDRLAYLAIASGGVPLLGLAGSSSTVQSMVLAFVPLYAVGLLAGFLVIAELVSSRARSTRAQARDALTPIAIGLSSIWLVSTVSLAALASLWWLLAADRSGLWTLVTLTLLFATLIHLVGLWPAALGLRRAAPARDAAVRIDRYPTSTGWRVVDEAITRCARLMAVGDAWGKQLAMAGMFAIRYPDTAIGDTIPARLMPWYHRRRGRTPGLTGTKLTVDESIYVIVLVLAAVVVIGLR